jgi:hypothetical protein
MPVLHADQEDRMMTESQQPKRGWFSGRREQRRVRRQLALESRLFAAEQDGDLRGLHSSASPYGHSGPVTYGAGGGWDGGGCGGDGGGGGGGC